MILGLVPTSMVWVIKKIDKIGASLLSCNIVERSSYLFNIGEIIILEMDNPVANFGTPIDHVHYHVEKMFKEEH